MTAKRSSSKFVDVVWYGWLKRPYRLAKPVDTGKGTPVIFLHGLGRSSETWQQTIEQLQGKPLRIIALDLLGFGQSPKPDLCYTVDDHAKAVIAAIRQLHVRQPIILVGHSMGCLVSVRVASLRPDLVRHLILYEMPLYNGLPDKRSYRLRLKFYFALYERIIAFKPIFNGPGKKRAQKLAEKIAGFTLDDATWLPFIRSLKHTIMEQKTHEDIKRIKLPMDVIYGTRDRVVIRGKTAEIFGEDVTNIAAHNIRENHGISKKAGAFLASRIEAAISVTESITAKTDDPSDVRL